MLEKNHQVMTTLANTTKINGIHPRVEMVSCFLDRSLFVGAERRIMVGILPIPKAFIMLTSKIQLLEFE